MGGGARGSTNRGYHGHGGRVRIYRGSKRRLERTRLRGNGSLGLWLYLGAIALAVAVLFWFVADGLNHLR